MIEESPQRTGREVRLRGRDAEERLLADPGQRAVLERLVALAERLGLQPELRLEDLDAPLIGAFLDHLERDRHNSVRTRNARLSAIHSLFRFAALRHPEHAGLIGRVLAIPPKRFERGIITFLADDEVQAILQAPDRTSFLGRRDHALLLLAVQAGLRVSELTRLTCEDVALGTGAHVRCRGKGRKQRATPLTTTTTAVLAAWLDERRGKPTDPLFPTRQGAALSRYGVTLLLSRHAQSAAQHCPSLATKKISPHVLRHTTAMRLLHAGVDTSVIALWLGCAVRRSVVSPAQRAEMRGDISGSDG